MKIARTATPGIGVQFRRDAYGDGQIRQFLRDVLAIANASATGPRYIVVGVEVDADGRKELHAVDPRDFSGKPAYQALANEYIEPPVQLRYKPVLIDGVRVGVFEIGDCQDKPYMMRVDYSELLRRGDAYRRVKDTAVKLGRRQLQQLFERKFRDSVSVGDVEIGFPGEIIHKTLTLATTDLSALPSAVASSKLEELLNIQRISRNSGSTTMVARLTHARLFGTDDPYVDRSGEELLVEMEQIRQQYHDADSHFLFEERARLLQLVIYNQGEEAITDTSLTLALPRHAGFHVAQSLPQRRVDDRFISRSPDEIAAYPSVAIRDDVIQVTSKIGDVVPGEPIEVFASALRLCIGTELRGRRFGLRYALHARNLRAPVRGKLKLIFR